MSNYPHFVQLGGRWIRVDDLPAHREKHSPRRRCPVPSTEKTLMPRTLTAWVPTGANKPAEWGGIARLLGAYGYRLLDSRPRSREEAAGEN